MSSTTFSNGTVIPVDWLNEVNDLLWGSASPPATPIRVNNNGKVGFGSNDPHSTIPVRIRKDSSTAVESDVAFRIDTSESAGGVGIGFGVTASTGIGYIQTVEPGTSYSSKSLVLQPNGGNIGIGGVPSTTYGLSSLWSYGSFVAASGQFNVHSTVSANYEFVHRATFGFDFYVNSGSTRVLSMTSAGDTLIRVNTAAPSITTNQEMVFTLTSNTNLRISVRGTDGVTRVANITLA